jgi:pilus assembly protein Flp/PilA
MFKIFVSASNFIAASLRRDDRGATAVEYGLIVALIAAVIIGIVAILGGQIATAFSSVSNKM